MNLVLKRDPVAHTGQQQLKGFELDRSGKRVIYSLEMELIEKEEKGAYLGIEIGEKSHPA